MIVKSQFLQKPLGLTPLKANVPTEADLNSLPVKQNAFQSIPASYILVIVGTMLRSELPRSQGSTADRKK